MRESEGGHARGHVHLFALVAVLVVKASLHAASSCGLARRAA